MSVEPKVTNQSTKTQVKESPSWILNYNLISGSLWSFILLNIIAVSCFYSTYELFDLTSIWTIIVQSLAIVEIYNSAVGNVKSPVLTTLMQVSSRLLLVFGIFTALPQSPANIHWSYITLTIAWSVTETMRYYYYAANIISNGNPPSYMKWFRYNSFIILYPMGISSECIMIYKSLNEAELVYGLWYKWFLIGCLLTYIPGSYTLFTYMLKQRSKVMKQLKSDKKKSS
ncbi:hypothetical protein CANARDRAFT_209385 [[Candida] arabinofermentans NRRL YB-2248]|uniref:Very-long-chain (3R)-3-hydroxyacyl-CoA dehydratase n=1 Tax=[Candida] arabinofermentans NRRL YB-2248 TaxID=983967 RepID=A0A1E4SUE9_9ASCO|nr:hypothetical protein CANARDRAFT_209385 [[Candida] arabinofermentans NRRL YB-2248]